MRRLVGLVGLVAAMTTAAAAPYDLAVGFAGGYRTGAWTPLIVTGGELTAGDVLHVWAEDPDGQFVRSPPAVAAVDAAGRVAARFVVRFGRPTGRVRIERHAGGGAASTVEQRLPAPLPATTRLLLVAGDLPALDDAARIVAPEDGPRPQVLPLDAARTAAGAAAMDYDAAETIVVCGRAVGNLPIEVLAGIDAWVRLGGRLVFVAGGSAEGLPSSAAAWLPAPLERLTTLTRFDGLEAHARAGRLPARAAGGVRVPLLPAAGPLPGVVDVSEGTAAAGIPLLVRRCHGLGTIAWLGVDVDAAPFRDWPGTVNLMAGLLGGRPEPAAFDRPTAGADVDLAAQFRGQLERFAPPAAAPAIRPVPFELVAGLGLLYVLCLYPLDWWLVSRGGGKPWLAWGTQVALVALFTSLAWAVHAGRQPPQPPGGLTVASREVVDIDAAGGMVRGTAWAAVYAVANDRIDVGLEVDDAASRAVSWWGDAGRGFGGVDAGMPHPALAATDYAYAGSLAALAGVPIAAASSRVFEAGWAVECEAGAAVTADLAAAAQGTLRGTLAHHLEFPLDDCRLVHGGWLYDVGRLEPGQRYDTSAGRGPRSLAAAVTRRGANKDRDVVVRWDPAAADGDRILEVAGFHAAAGGAVYTGATGGRFDRLDLSALVRLDRAVLVGRAARGQAAWSFAGRPAATSGLYRIVIPVAPAAAASRR